MEPPIVRGVGYYIYIWLVKLLTLQESRNRENKFSCICFTRPPVCIRYYGQVLWVAYNCFISLKSTCVYSFVSQCKSVSN